MSCSKINVTLHVRRFDISELPSIEERKVLLKTNLDFQSLKKELQAILGISENDNKVIKVRNQDGCLVPLPTLLERNKEDIAYIIDVSKIHYSTKNNANLLQDAYLDAIRQKLSNMEYRVSQAEVLVPQLQWSRQNHMEETVNVLSNKVAFLSRRIDELMPIQWRSKMPIT